MKALDYFKLVFSYANSDKYSFIYELGWYYAMFTLPALTNGTMSNKYIKIENNRYFVKIENEYQMIEDITIDDPIFKFQDKITVTIEECNNIEKAIESNIGRLIINRLMLADNFGNKIGYINEQTNPGALEKKIASNMYNNGTITVDEYLKFVDAASFVQSLSRIATISSTEKGMLPPPGLAEYKKKLMEEFNKKYGTNWVKDRSRIVEYENLLKEFDDKWLKDDPTYGKLTSGKVKNNARSRMYLMFGAEAGFDKKGLNVQMVNNSLLDGYPEDTEQLTTMFNTSRSGSYDRGKETQKGGAAAKDILRATSSIKIVPGDCGSKIGKDIFVTKNIADKLIGRYQIINGKIVVIEKPETLIGKTITIRSPQYCKQDGSSFCAKCVGDVLANYESGISLIVTNISSILLNSSMKSMHSHSVKSMAYNITESIY
jgi:hypothetical protein